MRWGILVFAFLLSGCDRAVTACEDEIKNGLKAPSTYERIKSSSYRFDDDENPHVSVTIEYDAKNSFGTPLRSTAFCEVPIEEGTPNTSKAIIRFQM
ncbi:hypothetical protein [Erythrobacter sp. SG61-1L]|uniref:hypothetical protein n=1 Tax=Erythrobacter sp. SG61-1L TaxID=1603897 RepID=UPI000A4BF2B0|nr:hypothetical protein [Erythrobacter sp. SG61-1L]